jgi:hypothetical protein
MAHKVEPTPNPLSSVAGFLAKDYKSWSPVSVFLTARQLVMAAAPWYLLAGGIVLVIAGFFIAHLGSRGSGRIFISPKMSDKEIERLMNEPQGCLLGNLLILLGFLVIFISVVWRLVRIFV